MILKCNKHLESQLNCNKFQNNEHSFLKNAIGKQYCSINEISSAEEIYSRISLICEKQYKK